MELPQVGTVGFVIVLVAFFTSQFNLKGNLALGAAFLVSLLFNAAPLLSDPAVTSAAIVNVILNTILLTISASGGYNFIGKIASKISGN